MSPPQTECVDPSHKMTIEKIMWSGHSCPLTLAAAGKAGRSARST
jgi:hypothetical protein